MRILLVVVVLAALVYACTVEVKSHNLASISRQVTATATPTPTVTPTR